MAEATSNRSELGPRLPAGKRLTRATVGVLFYLILLIPRVRRLRRRVVIWSLIRTVAMLTGAILFRIYFQTRSPGYLAGGLILAVMGLLLRATPVVRTLDERARELGALAVLNGGSITLPGGESQKVNLFVGREKIQVESASGTLLLEIPMALVRSCAGRASSQAEGSPFDLEITWGDTPAQTTRFHFEGFFAEHLARVAESAIESLRKQSLPVLP